MNSRAYDRISMTESNNGRLKAVVSQMAPNFPIVADQAEALLYAPL